MCSVSNSFLTPYLRYSRFYEATRNSGYKVFAVPPGTLPGSEMAFANKLLDRNTSAEIVRDLDSGDHEIGFPVGAINCVTAVEVSSAEGQEFMDNLDLEGTARIWTPAARYYLFDYLTPADLSTANKREPSLRVLNDGELVPYPGAIVDGQLVHWELDPWAFGTIPLPREFWCS